MEQGGPCACAWCGVGPWVWPRCGLGVCGLGAMDAGTVLQSCCVLLGSIRPSRGETVGARRRTTTGGAPSEAEAQKRAPRRRMQCLLDRYLEIYLPVTVAWENVMAMLPRPLSASRDLYVVAATDRQVHSSAAWARCKWDCDTGKQALGSDMVL